MAHSNMRRIKVVDFLWRPTSREVCGTRAVTMASDSLVTTAQIVDSVVPPSQLIVVQILAPETAIAVGDLDVSDEIRGTSRKNASAAGWRGGTLATRIRFSAVPHQRAQELDGRKRACTFTVDASLERPNFGGPLAAALDAATFTAHRPEPGYADCRNFSLARNCSRVRFGNRCPANPLRIPVSLITSRTGSGVSRIPSVTRIRSSCTAAPTKTGMSGTHPQT